MLWLAALLLTASAAHAQVQCDPTHSCPNGNTCCTDVNGDWACCPFAGATCCSDHEHCCPPQYPVCDMTAGQCVKSLGAHLRAFSVPLASQRPASVVAAPADQTCPDGSSCPDTATCCDQGDGTFACCPVAQATCCSDNVHCCPPEYPVCDVSGGQCRRSAVRGAGDADADADATAWLAKFPSQRRA